MRPQTIRVARLISSGPRWFQKGCHTKNVLRIKYLGNPSVCDVRHHPLPLAAYPASQRRVVGSPDRLTAARVNYPVGQNQPSEFSLPQPHAQEAKAARARLRQCAEPVSKLVML